MTRTCYTLFALVASAVVTLSGCSKNPTYCDEATPCESAFETCDLTGALPGADGVAKSCVPTPCVSDAECGGALCESGTCAPCGDSQQCTDRGLGQACLSSGFCAECTSDAQCPEVGAPICGDNACRGCETNTECTTRNPDFPICNELGVCAECAGHNDCPSKVCVMEEGVCADPEIVFHVDPGGEDTGDCQNPEAPCKTMAYVNDRGTSLLRAFVQMEAGEYTASNLPLYAFKTWVGNGVTIRGTNDALPLMTDNGAVVAFRGDILVTGQASLAFDIQTELILDGTTIQNITGDGLAFSSESKGTLTNVVIAGTGGDGLSISEASTVNVTDVRISDNDGVGIIANSAGLLSVDRAEVAGNGLGGISIQDMPFEVRNSMIHGNGGPATTFGGLRIDFVVLLDPDPALVEFTTIVDNEASAAKPYELDCDGFVTIDSSIIWNHSEPNTADIVEANTCTINYSMVRGGHAGTGNTDATPTFVSVGAGDYHLQSGSLGIDAANPAATLAWDFDGEMRPIGAARDIGADEVPQ